MNVWKSVRDMFSPMVRYNQRSTDKVTDHKEISAQEDVVINSSINESGLKLEEESTQSSESSVKIESIDTSQNADDSTVQQSEPEADKVKEEFSDPYEQIAYLKQRNTLLKTQNRELSDEISKCNEDIVKLENKLAEKEVEQLNSAFDDLTEERETSAESPNKIEDSVDWVSSAVKEWFEQANTMYVEHQYKEALDLYSKIVVVGQAKCNDSPALSIIYNQISLCYYELDQIDKALENVEKAIELDGSHAIQFYNRAVFYWQLNDQAEVVSNLEKAFESDPNDEYVNRWLANIKQE